MKKVLYILSFVLFTGSVAMAQENDSDRIRDKMREFIQKRLNLSKREATNFTPVFIRYFKDWRQTLRENKDDGLVRTQRIAELRIRYRNEFREIVGEKRTNDIYRQQDVFINELRSIRQEQLRNNLDNRRNQRIRPGKQ